MTSKKIFLPIVLLIAGGFFLYMVFAKSNDPEKSKVQQPAEHQHGQTTEKKERKILYYVDSMHPWYKSDKPGIAPDCGMQLTPVYADDETEMAGEASPGTVKLSGKKQQLINLKVVEVSQGTIGQNIRTVGTLQYDETRIAKIHSKIEGWIEQVYVDYTGQFVRKGQPLFSIYSPELVATQQEYLLALKAEQSLGTSEFADVSSGAKSLKVSALRRLKLWDVSDKQIEQLEETQTPMTTITFYSPVSGFVLEKNVFEKQRVTYETQTYSIADISTIWLMADIYEYEAANVKSGQKALMTLSYDPGRKFEGKVTYIYPSLNNMTRTLKVRIEFPNPNFLLKPDMYANVELQTEQGSGLMIPEEAVLDSGNRQIVFVEKSKGEFEPREVKTGLHSGGNVVIASGLTAGEKVVASGNFLIDSESQLKSALESMGTAGHQHGQ
ncbi:efflux RND transporter periplasmic adaptor subunit [bacterium]|nr:efflux RND transporter periplasmic adaptor subunit [bacterium]